MGGNNEHRPGTELEEDDGAVAVRNLGQGPMKRLLQEIEMTDQRQNGKRGGWEIVELVSAVPCEDIQDQGK